MALIPSQALPARGRSAAMACSTAAHQSAGFCSDHSSFGRETESGAAGEDRLRPVHHHRLDGGGADVDAEIHQAFWATSM
jgi:hypothetical protein